MTDDERVQTADAGAGTGSGDGAETDPLEVLLRVQDLDTALARLEHRRATLPERGELEAAQAALADLRARVADARERRQALVDRQAELEEQVAAISSRSKVLEDRMYAARGSAARDLQAMDDEIHQLARRRAEIEEVELAIMEEQEPIDAEIDRMGGELDDLETVAGSLGMAVAASEAVVSAEISTMERSRGLEAAKLPTALGDHYEVLRGRLAGVGAARLVGNRCDGCHLELPSAEVDRIRHLPQGTVVTCDQCGRILVRTAGSALAPASGPRSPATGA